MLTTIQTIPTPKTSSATINGKDYQLVAFYFPGHETAWDKYYQAPFCGNFWAQNLTMTIDNITGTFQTAEAAFQSTKWWKDDNIRKEFEGATSGNEAFRIKKKHQANGWDQNYAGLGRNGAMSHVLAAKFEDPGLKAALLATGDAYLLEHNEVAGRDTHWSDNAYTGVPHTVAGHNQLGIELMKLRVKLGGEPSPGSNLPVVDFTTQVQTADHHQHHDAIPMAAAAPSTNSGLTIVPSVYTKDDQEGDFLWMIKQPSYTDAFFIFNDNKNEFLVHYKDHSDGCQTGGGNACIRPWQCHTPPKALGIPTGPDFPELTADVKALIDKAVEQIRQTLAANKYTRVIYSSNGHGGLGVSIFAVPDDVKSYIVQQIQSLAD